MIQTNSAIQFCTVPHLIKFGFTRPDAYATMSKMKTDYQTEGYYIPNEKKNELPLEYVNDWLSKHMAINQRICF